MHHPANWDTMSYLDKCKWELSMIESLECLGYDIKNQARTYIVKEMRVYEKLTERIQANERKRGN